MDVQYAYWNIFFFGLAIAVYSGYSGYALYKVKFNIDKSAIVMIALYFISLLLKLISWSLYFKENENKKSEALGWI